MSISNNEKIHDFLGITKSQLNKTDDELGIIEVVTGIDDDGDISYAYVAIKPSLYMEYQQKVIDQDEIDLDYYGNILYSKKGQYPSAEDQKEIEVKFGIDHKFMSSFSEQFEDLVSDLQKGV